MQISVVTLGNNTLVLDVEPTDTIECVKAKVKGAGFHPKFELGFNFQQLENDRTLNDYNISNESILHMAPILFFVNTPYRKLIHIIVFPWTTIEKVKSIIQTETGLPIYDQRLIYRQKQLADNITVDEYNIEPLSIVHMVRHLRFRCYGECQPRSIFVQNVLTNESITLEVTLIDTIKSVKAKIQVQTGIPINQQRLTFGDKVLTDDEERLMDYNIETESTVHLDVS